MAASCAVPTARITGIVEHKDATAAQREVREVYTGVMAAPTAALKRWLVGAAATTTPRASTT